MFRALFVSALAAILLMAAPSYADVVTYIKRVSPTVASEACLTAGETAVQSVYPDVVMTDLKVWDCTKKSGIWHCGIEYNKTLDAGVWSVMAKNGEMHIPASVDGSSVVVNYNSTAVQLTNAQRLAHRDIVPTCLGGVNPDLILWFSASRDEDGNLVISYHYINTGTSTEVADLARQGLVIKILSVE